MKTISIKYDIGDEVMVPDVDGIHTGIVMHVQWNNSIGAYYTVQYLQYDQNNKAVPIYWEFTEEEIDKAISVANNDK